MLSRNTPDGIIVKKTTVDDIATTTHMFANHTIFKGIVVRGRRENKVDIISDNLKITADYLHGLRVNVSTVIKNDGK